MNKRIKKLQGKLTRLGAQGILISREADIKYLADLYQEGVFLLVPAKGEAVYFIDVMNQSLAEKVVTLPGIKIVSRKSSIAKALKPHLKEAGIKRLLYDSLDLSVALYNSIKKECKSLKLVDKVKRTPASILVGKMREVKSEEEIKVIRKSARITVKIWKEVKRKIRVGLSEKEIASLVDVAIKKSGCENSFPTIAAAGVNTAYPHSIPTSRKLKRGEHVLVDFGIRYKGYCSDLTRIWDKGRINRQIEAFKTHVQKAHDEAIKAIRPGASIGLTVKRSHNVFSRSDLGKYILHGLGHGVGLEIHEAPFLRETSKDSFREGMVVTVEPGLYKTGLGGIRLEDMVLVTKKGSEVLTR